jgi:Domain of unknown function (DUF4412)
MKTAAAVLAAFVAGSSAALAQWEGVADFKVTTNTSKGESIPGTGKIFVTTGAYRMEWESDVSAVHRGRHAAATPVRLKMTLFGKASDPDHLTMIDDTNKTYSVWDVKKARDDWKGAPKETYTVQKLGSDTVAGLSCQKASLTASSGTVIDVCLARDFTVSSDWLAALQRRQREGGNWLSALRENGLTGFPVRYAMRRKDATEPFMTMVLTHLEKGPVSAALFEVPAGYRQTEFAMGGLSPEQQKAVADARARMKETLEHMTPEQRKAYEDAMKRYAKPTPSP